jgi:predicted pyridoxine 5'-phosphate oxidase superfamily flavin-nucleotide-binding protein
MTKRMKQLFTEVRIASFATADANGIPNVVPVGAKKIIDDETILISDQFFNKTLANVKANPKAALTLWRSHEGYQIKGSISIETQGERFEETAAWIAERSSKDGFPRKCKGVLILHIDAIYSVAPGPGAGKQLA